jgi:hypothetical protein
MTGKFGNVRHINLGPVVTPAVSIESHHQPCTVPWPSHQRAFVAAHFSAARATLPLAFRARPIALPALATYCYAEDQLLLVGGTSIPSRGNFLNRSRRFSLGFSCGPGLCHQIVK